MKTGNRIRRNTTVIIFKQLVDTTAGKKGDIFRAWRNDCGGWTERNITTGSTQLYQGFISFYRNENLSQIITQY